VIGIDVDDYNDKPGADTMTATTQIHGYLPRTWISTSRTGTSGIRWFTLDHPQTLPGKLVHPDNNDMSGVEIIQHTHRYAIVPPSTHPEGGHYQWVTPDGQIVEDNTLPTPDTFPAIPQPWVDHILQDCSCWAPYNWDRHTPNINDPVKTAYDKWAAKMTASYGRHDAALGGVMALVAFKERGWPGADHHLEQLKNDFHTALDDTRTPPTAEAEWERMVEGAEKTAVTTTIPIWQPHQTTTTPSPETFDARVEQELDQLRVRDKAKRRFNLEINPPQELPPLITLDERLQKEWPDVEWRVESWQPIGTRALLAAQYKAGKTTLTGNLTRSLVDGTDFLNSFTVTTARKVTILDFEMSERQIDHWLKDQGITNTNRIVIAPLRGKAATFNILEDTTRREWATRLKGTEYLILDCLRPVMDALGLDEHREAGRFLTAFDALCNDAEIEDALVVHHMGHLGERSRGDSRLRDWPDVEWRLVRATEDPDSKRFISAFGRDVDVAEGELVHDPTTRHLHHIGGSRHEARAREALPEVVEALINSSEHLGFRALRDLVHRQGEHSKSIIEQAIKIGQRDHVLHVVSGSNNSALHHHTTQCPGVPECPGSVLWDSGVSVPVSYKTGTHTDTPETLLEQQLGARHVTEESDLPDAY